MIDREILKPLCGESLVLHRPFACAGWDCATNGRAILMLRGETLEPPSGTLPSVATLIEHAERGENERETKLSALRGWARGAGALHPPCDCCGTPSDETFTVTGYVGPLRVNVCLLSHYLPDGLPDSPVTVRWGNDVLAPLLLKAADWQLILMPLNPEPEGHRFQF